MAYTSLFKKDDVRVTQAFSSTHKGLDLSRGVVEQPIYLPSKAQSGYVWKILPGYTSGGVYYPDAPIIYVKHPDGSGSRYIHSYPRNVKVKVGDTVAAGQQICCTGNSGHSFGDHLHFEWLTKWDDLNTRVDPASFVMNDKPSSFKVGDQIQIIESQNIRKGSGVNYKITQQTLVGQIYTIEGGPRIADGYTWWDLQNADWIADVGKFEIYTPIAPVEPPAPPEQTECEKEIERLQGIIDGVNEALGNSQSALEGKVLELKTANERVSFLEGTLVEREKELDGLEADYARVLEERNNFEKQYIEVVTELNELKAGRDSWISRLADILHKLFGGK